MMSTDQTLKGSTPLGSIPMNALLSSRFVMLEKIAQGPRTVSLKAYPRQTSGTARAITLKHLHPEHGGCAQARSDLLYEAWAQSSTHHSGVLGSLETIETDDGVCLVQNYIEGESLETLLKIQGASRPLRCVIAVVVNVLEALHAVHTALDEDESPLLLRHGAVRAHHVIVGTDGTARLIDFSAARSSRASLDRPSPAPQPRAEHMAPEEVLSPSSVDLRADLFLVGVMLWEALTSTRLFAGEDDEVTVQCLLHRPVLGPSKVVKSLSPSFDSVCLRALAREPEKRYGSALDMVRDLRAAALQADMLASRAEISAWVSEVRASAVATSVEPSATPLDVADLWFESDTRAEPWAEWEDNEPTLVSSRWGSGVRNLESSAPDGGSENSPQQARTQASVRRSS